MQSDKCNNSCHASYLDSIEIEEERSLAMDTCDVPRSYRDSKLVPEACDCFGQGLASSAGMLDPETAYPEQTGCEPASATPLESDALALELWLKAIDCESDLPAFLQVGCPASDKTNTNWPIGCRCVCQSCSPMVSRKFSLSRLAKSHRTSQMLPATAGCQAL